jgi:nitroimidazol reductase NimA-like FMN-containing flavoprotein (pyridoxamine 5'-phosphate oxidase superfamily)
MGPRPRASIESGRSAPQTARLKSTLGELFKSQYFSVLATRSDGRLHTSLVAFVATEDLDAIVFATPKATRKFHNLSAHPEVSLLVDNRSNDAVDIYNVTAVTVSGTAEALAGAGREDMLRLYLKKHPYMEEFVRSPNSALVRVNVRKYDVVTDFQNVMVLTIVGGERPQ